MSKRKRPHESDPPQPAPPDYTGGNSVRREAPAARRHDEAEAAVDAYRKLRKWDEIRDDHLPELIEKVPLAPLSLAVAGRLVDLRLRAATESPTADLTFEDALRLPRKRKGQDRSAPLRQAVYATAVRPPHARAILQRVGAAFQRQALFGHRKPKAPPELVRDAAAQLERVVHLYANRAGISIEQAYARFAAELGLRGDPARGRPGAALADVLRRRRKKETAK
jgi:hypothetical protein